LTVIVSLHAGRIGFAIARRLAQDGAHVVISSRKQQNVDRAVTTLKEEGLSVTGTVCHVGKAEDRERLVAMVSCRDKGMEPGGGRRDTFCAPIPDFLDSFGEIHY
jgi:NAD(P)-dependent dehydrogenase (short-subunit alcohol dehydrogenase family)